MNNYYNALSEVSTILQHLELKELKKIPTEIIKDIEENKNLEYTYEIDNEKKLSEQKMLPETQAILSILYRDYIATEEKRKRIKETEKMQIIRTEKEKEQIYGNKVLFNTKDKITAMEIVDEKQTLIKKIKNKIINLLKKFMKN